MKLKRIKKNPANPRFIRDDKFEQLKRSVVRFPEMLALRPIVVDEKSVALGGNMRYEALYALHKEGFEEIYPEDFSREKLAYRKKCYEAIRTGELLGEWVVKASDLSEEQKQEFIIKDNVPFGSWDDDILANNFSDFPLADWGLDFIPPTSLDINEFFENAPEAPEIEQKHTISLTYTAEEFNRVSPALLKYGKSYEQAVWKLLGL